MVQDRIWSGETDTELDDLALEVLSNTAEAVSNEEAFDAMIESWDRRLSIPEERENPAKLNRLLSNLEQMMQLFGAKVRTALFDDISQLVSRESVASVILTPDLRVVYRNQAWSEYARALSSGALRPEDIEAEDHERMLAALSSLNADGEERFVLIRVHDSSHTQTVFLMSVVRDLRDNALLHLKQVTIGWTNELATLLAEAYGFTDAELQIAAAILQGAKPDQIAAARPAALATVRKQIQSLLRKCHVSSQGELVKLIALVAANLHKPLGEMTYEWSDPWEAEKRLIRPGGHVVAYSEIGRRDGASILLVHGEGIGYALPGLPDLARQHGLRIFAIQRPGHGNSAIGEDETGLDAAVAAAAHLCNAVIGKPRAIVALHSAIPMMMRGLASGQLDTDHFFALNSILSINSASEKMLPAVQRAWFRMARKSRKATKFATEAGWIIVKRRGLEWYLERYFAGNTHDLAEAKKDKNKYLLVSAAAMMLREGTSALVEDMRSYGEGIAAGEWSGRTSLTMILGRRNPLYSSDELARVRKKYGDVEIIEIPDGAELIAYTHVETILQAICRKIGDGQKA